MSRPYPYSREIQPRFAAFLLSRGLPINPNVDAPKGWQAEFMAWISAALKWAEKRSLGVEMAGGSVRYPRINNHDDFTEACWLFAETRP